MTTITLASHCAAPIPTTTGTHAHPLAAFKEMGRFAPIDENLTEADLTDDDRAEFQRMELHQRAYNELGRARCALLHFSTDYTRASAHAQSAIAAMAELALMNIGAQA